MSVEFSAHGLWGCDSTEDVVVVCWDQGAFKSISGEEIQLTGFGSLSGESIDHITTVFWEKISQDSLLYVKVAVSGGGPIGETFLN